LDSKERISTMAEQLETITEIDLDELLAIDPQRG
jgi:hypothetical protein